MSTQAPYGFSARGGLTRNPYNLSCSTFGSSSGSAVAVAANLAMAALGTETDGSIITPSAVAGVVGLKPTFDARFLRGMVPVARSMDTVRLPEALTQQVGAIARTAIDTALLAKVIAGDVVTTADFSTKAVQLPAVSPRTPSDLRGSASASSPTRTGRTRTSPSTGPRWTARC